MSFTYNSDHIQFLSDATNKVDMNIVTHQFNVHFGLDKSRRQLLAAMQKHNVPVVVKMKRSKKHSLNDLQKQWLSANYHNMSNCDLSTEFNKRFSTNYTHSQFLSILYNYGFKGVGKSKGGFGKFKFDLSKEQVRWLKTNYQLLTRRLLLEKFNKEYGQSLSMIQFVNILNNYEIKSNCKASEKHGYTTSCTVFKKGDAHPTSLPVGSERVENNYVIVKVAEPNVWKQKQRIVYEQHFGELKVNEVVRFKDGNNRNFAPDNLFKTSRKGHGFLSSVKLLSQPKPVQESLLIITMLRDKTDQVKLTMAGE